MKLSGNLKTWSIDWFFLFFAIVSAALFLAGSRNLLLRLFCPFQVNQGEAINVEFARLIHSSSSLYHDPSQAPYLYAAYPPLFPILQNYLGIFLNGPWFPGRLLALSGYLGCALALGYWGFRNWNRMATLALGSLFLLSPTWASWGSMVRTDTLMIFLGFITFLILSLFEQEKEDGKKSNESILLMAGSLTAISILLKLKN